MKKILNLLIPVLLTLAFFSPQLISDFSGVGVLCLLVLLNIVTAFGFGFWLFIGIRSDAMHIVSTSNANKTLNESLAKRNIFMLRVGEGALLPNIVICTDIKSLMALASKIFIPSLWLSLAFVATAAMSGILLGLFRNSRGLFDRLLQSESGSGLLLSICMYLGFIGFTFFTVGFLAFINKGGAK